MREALSIKILAELSERLSVRICNNKHELEGKHMNDCKHSSMSPVRKDRLRKVGETRNHNEVRAKGVIFAMRCDLQGEPERKCTNAQIISFERIGILETFHLFTLPGQENNVSTS